MGSVVQQEGNGGVMDALQIQGRKLLILYIHFYQFHYYDRHCCRYQQQQQQQ